MNFIPYATAREFLDHTAAVAKQSKTVKLNPLRDAIAKASGYHSTNDFLTYLDINARAQCLCEEMDYLTNGLLEDCSAGAGITQEYFRQHNLGFHLINGSFFPLSVVEDALLHHEPLSDDFAYQLSSGYSTLADNKKYIAVCFEVDFDNADDDMLEQEAYTYALGLKEALIDVALTIEGAKVFAFPEQKITGEEQYGCFNVNLYVPFSFALSIATDFEQWSAYITPKLKAAMTARIELIETNSDTTIKPMVPPILDEWIAYNTPDIGVKATIKEHNNDDLLPFLVSLYEDEGDQHTIDFYCLAANDDHAAEQALDAYRNGEVKYTSEIHKDDYPYTINDAPVKGDNNNAK